MKDTKMSCQNAETSFLGIGKLLKKEHDKIYTSINY